MLHSRFWKPRLGAQIASLVFLISPWNATLSVGQTKEGGPSTEQLQTADFYLAGMWDMRERLVAGEFKAVEHKSYSSDEAPGEIKAQTGRVTCSFDVAKDGFRFDRRFEYKPDIAVTRHLNLFARNKDESFFYRDDDKRVLKRQPEADHGDPYKEWDVRLVGLGNSSAFDLHAYPFSKLREVYSKRGAPTEVSEKDGVCQLTWTGGEGGRFRRRLTIDRRQGFAATRYEDLVRQPPDLDDWKTWSVTEVTWQEKSGAWIPTRIDFIDPKAPDNKDFIELEWISVNQPVPDKRFSYEDFSLPAGTEVWDMRVDPSILESVVAAGPQPQMSRVWMFLGIGIISCLALVAAVLYFRGAFQARQLSKDV